MEKSRGIEALRSVPMKEILLKREEAIAKLSAHTLTVVTGNTEDFSLLRNSRMSWYKGGVDSPNLISDGLKPGGLSLTDHDYDLLMNNYGSLSFKQGLQGLIEDVFPGFLMRDSVFRAQGTLCFNYLLDLLNIIDPKIATFDEGVKVIMESMRETDTSFNSYLLGVIVDDILNRKGTKVIPFEFYADLEETERFKQAYLRFASTEEKLSFTHGLNNTREETELNLRGISTS